MTDLTQPEQEWLATLDELRAHPEIEVSEEYRGKLRLGVGDADKAFAELAEWEGITLPESLKPHYFRFAYIGSYWRLESPDSAHSFAGEFHLTHLHEAVQEPSPVEIWSGLPGLSEDFLKELHPFDGTPTTGVGHLSLLRSTEGESNPEVWFNANPYVPHRMDLDYPTYLETLRITKGTFSWQYLFVDPSEVDLSSEEFESAGKRLTSMLEVFPRMFPDHDYSDLRARLEARL